MTTTQVSGGGTVGSSFTHRRVGNTGVGSPLVGAWEMVDDTEQGMVIFTGTHYATVRMHKERDLPKGEQYTPQEALEAISTSGAITGTYTVSGNTVSAERIASLHPTSVGVTLVHQFTVEGDTLSLRGISGIPLEETTWRRVS